MELWTGLASLVANPACKHFKRFGDGKGAYVNVVALAESAKHFEGRVATIAGEQLDCIVREMERVESLEAALEPEGCPDEFFPATWMSGYVGPAAGEWFDRGGFLLPNYIPPVRNDWIQRLGEQHPH